MQAFKRILFVADRSKGSAAALRKFRELAEHYGATLTLIDVIPDYAGHYVYPETGEGLTALREALREDSKKELSKLQQKSLPKTARNNRKQQLPVVIREGTDYVEIIKQVSDG